MVRPNVGIDQHPDIAQLRDRFDRVSATPTVSVTEGLLLVAGVYLAASPWIVGFAGSQSDLAANNFVVGFAVAALAFSFATAYGRTHLLSWVPVVLGIWTIISPAVIQGTYGTAGSIASNIVCGLVITMLAVLTMAFGMRRGGNRGQAEHAAR